MADPIILNLLKGQTLAYQCQISTATGFWYGQLPAGLTLSVVAGIPKFMGAISDVAGTYGVRIEYLNGSSSELLYVSFVITDPSALAPPVISCIPAVATNGGGTLTVPAGNFVLLFQTTNNGPSGPGWAFSTLTGFNASTGQGYSNSQLSFSATLPAGTYFLPVSFSNFAYSGGPVQTSNYNLTVIVSPALPVVSLALPESLSSFTGKAVWAQFDVQTNAGAVAWSATTLPTGCTINAATGLVSGTPTVSGSFAAVITATNSTGNPTFPATFAITASAPAPVITCKGATPTTAGGTITKTAGDFNLQFMATNSGDNWSASLPYGLNINSTYGYVAGSLGAGVYSIAVSCSNTPYSGGPTQTTQYVLEMTVPAALPIISINDGSGLNVTMGSAVSARFTVQANAGSVAWSAVGLPLGCVINPSNGMITGTPQSTGTSNTTITATNETGAATYAASFVITSGTSGSTTPTYPFLLDDPSLTDLQIDVRTGVITSSRPVAYKQFQLGRFALVFLDFGAPMPPPAAAAVHMGIRPKDQFGADYLFPLVSATLSAGAEGQPSYLLMEFPISGDALAREFKALLDAANTTGLPVMTDVVWKTADGVPRASQTFNFPIQPAVTY